MLQTGFLLIAVVHQVFEDRKTHQGFVYFPHFAKIRILSGGKDPNISHSVMCAQIFGLMGLTSSTCHYLWLHFFFFFFFNSYFPSCQNFLLVTFLLLACGFAFESRFTRHARTDHTLIQILVAYFRRGRLNSELWFVSCSLSLPLCLSTSVLGLLFTGEHTWRFWLTYTLCLPSRSSFQQTAVSNVICGGGGNGRERGRPALASVRLVEGHDSTLEQKETTSKTGHNWLKRTPLTPQFSERLCDLNSLYLICLDICLAFWANTYRNVVGVGVGGGTYAWIHHI